MTDDATTVRGLLAAAHLPVSDAELDRLVAARQALGEGIDALYAAVDDLDAGSAQVFVVGGASRSVHGLVDED